MNQKKINKIAIVIISLSLLIAGFFLGKCVYKKPLETGQIILDSLYVVSDSLDAENEDAFMSWENIYDLDLNLEDRLPVVGDKGVSYKKARMDTTFVFTDSTWHKLGIEYDILKNKFFLDSKFRVYQAIDVPLVSTQQDSDKSRIKPYLMGSMAFGENDRVLGIGVGVKYKKVGIGAAVYSNKTAGGMITYEF